MSRVLGQIAVCSALAAGFAAAVGALGCGRDEDSLGAGRNAEASVVARLGDREIRLGEVRQWLAGRPGALRRASRPGGSQAELDSLVELVIVEDEAKRLGLESDPAFVEQRDEVRARAAHQEREILRRLLFERLETSAEITEADLRARYDATQANRVTSRIHLRQIVVEDEKAAESVHARVANGEDFAAIAVEVSVLPELRARRGDLGPMLRSDVPPELRTPAFSLAAADDVSEPFPVGGRWSVLQLVSRDPSVPVPFEQARSQIERELRRERAAEAFQKLVEARRDDLQVDEALLATLGPPAPRGLPERAPRVSSPSADSLGGETRESVRGGH